MGCEVIAQQCKSPQELIALVADADYVITQFAPMISSVIDAMEKCKVIVRYGIGVDNVDLDATAARGIPVCNVPDYCINEVADHTLGLILALNRQLVRVCNHVRDGLWKLPVPFEQIRVLTEMVVGVVGYGRIGRAVAERLKPFRCKILVSDPAVEASAVRASGCIPVTFDELLKTSDLITLHCPSTDQTRYMINEDSLQRVKKGVLLVNASRGNLIKIDALIAALRGGQVSAVALDVTDPEPINTDSPLLKMENVIITNHIASVSVSAREKLRTGVANTVVCAIRGEKLPNVVNNV
jgi:D-3-phosphoglycerate dehydrogenase